MLFLWPEGAWQFHPLDVDVTPYVLDIVLILCFPTEYPELLLSQTDFQLLRENSKRAV